MTKSDPQKDNVIKSPLRNIPGKYTAALFILILLAGFILRVQHPELVAFQYNDELRDYHQVIRVLDGEESLPFYGPTFFPYTSYQIPGNFFYILTMLPYSFSSHPMAGVWFMYLLLFASVLISYQAFKKLFTLDTARIATALYAIAPWAIFATRKYHHPYFVPFFSALLLLLLALTFKEKKARFFALALPVSILAFQVHTAALGFVVATLILALIYRKEMTLSALIGGGLISIALYAPFIIHELEHGFAATRAFFALESNSPGIAPDFLKALTYPLLFATGEISYFFRHQTLNMLGMPSLFGIFSIVMLLVTGSIMIFTGYRSLRAIASRKRLAAYKNANPEYLIVFITAASVIAFHLFRFHVPHPHYLYGLLPLSFLLMGLFFSGHPGFHPKKKFLQFLQKYALIPTILYFILTSGIALQFINLEGGTTGHFKTNLRDQLNAIEYMEKQSSGNFRVQEGPGYVWNETLGPVRMFNTIIRGMDPNYSFGKGGHVYHYHWCQYGTSAPLNKFQQALAFKKFHLLYIFRIQ